VKTAADYFVDMASKVNYIYLIHAYTILSIQPRLHILDDSFPHE
jgi:hypothetical protein